MVRCYAKKSALLAVMALAAGGSWHLSAARGRFPASPQHAATSPRSQPTPELSRFEFAQPHMGTLFRIVLYAPDQATADRASSAAFKRIADLDHIMSDYDPSSELMQLSSRAGGPPVHLSNDLFRVMTAAQKLAWRSDGAFDVTVGPVVRLWRRARRRHELPDPERLDQARSLVGYRLVQLNTGAHTARLLKPGMLLDLGGIAKGDAADQALIVLRHQGIESALVAAAGDIANGAAPPRAIGDPVDSRREASGWKIALAPLEAQRKAPGEANAAKLQSHSRSIYLHDCAISTSGDSAQHLDLGEVRYSHIVNPKTGMALTGYRSVTVIAPRGIDADSLATAASVLGPERGIALVKSTPGAGVLYVEQSGSGVRSSQWNFPASAPTRE
jgi:FAD:protein FMN transferase